jgi:hypothetical protein
MERLYSNHIQAGVLYCSLYNYLTLAILWEQQP